MFLLVSVRHVGAHPGEHGVSIQISISLVKHFFGYLVYEIFLWPESWRGSFYMYLLSFPDSGLYLLKGFDFYFELFWMAWHWKPSIPIIMQTICSREILTKKCRQQQNFDSDPREAWHYNQVTFTPIAKNFMLYCRLIYVLSMLYVRLTIKVKVGILESFKVR